ncbi:helix-turn-helix transcriptional regulator [Exiguobacterium indicum]|uniref:helix-turn-helix domain-containing protein n=1 Tax=Exiguobacterium indicum TaxID=296995 RepID=UPI00398260B0
MSTLGERIKERRKIIGLTQSDLAGSNLSSGMVSLIERNLTNPSLKTIEQLSEKLGVSVNYLLNNEETDINNIENKQISLNMLKGLIKAQKFEEAERILKEVNSQGEIDSTLAGMYYKLKGELELEKKEFNLAIDSFEQALLYLNPYELNEYVDVYYHLANCYVKIENFRKSIELSLQGILLLNTSHTDTNVLLKLKLLYLQSYSYCRIREFKKGLQVIEEAKEIMNETNCYYNEGMYCMLSGLAYLYLKEFDKGIEQTERSIGLLNKDTQYLQVIGCSTNLGILYRETKNYERSIKSLEDSLLLSKTRKIDWSIWNNNLELAITFYRNDDIEKSQKICEESLVQIKDSNVLKIKMMLLLSKIKLDQDKNGEALLYVNEAKKEALIIDNSTLMAKCYVIKAEILKKQQLYEEAFNEIRKSVQIYESSNENLYDSFPTE